jgi:hypothetical protein
MPKFVMPEGVEVPEGLEPGEPFQVMATIVIGDGGKAELVEVDGKVIAGYGGKAKGKKAPEMESEGEETEVEVSGPDAGDFIGRVMSMRGGR